MKAVQMNFSFILVSKDVEVINRVKCLAEELHIWHCILVTSNYHDSFNTLLKENPDVVFVDLDLTNTFKNFFENLKELSSLTDQLPDFIALSKSRDFAYDSIKFGFVDYLLKPLFELELRKSFMKLQKKRKDKISKMLCLKSYSDYHFIEIDEISYLQADNNTTDIHLNSGKKITAYKTLKYFEDLLPKKFIRIHNSYVVNIEQVRRINFGNSKISLSSSEHCDQLPFSKTYRDSVNNLRKVLASNNISSF